jgi:CheY-like chemotaxis protein
MQPLKLLIVEENIASLGLMSEVFTSLKADVRPVSDSEKAWGMVNQEKFDGIFLELEMRRLDGFGLARLIRKSSWNRSTPIVVVTGREERKTMQDAFATGVTFFLRKPVDRQKLNGLFRTVSGGMLENRLNHTRVRLQVQVACRVGSRTMRGVTWNLSHGGLQLQVRDLKLKDDVRLSFKLPISGTAIDADGTVVWGNEKRQGIQFRNTGPLGHWSIRQFIAEPEKMGRSVEP